MKFWSSNFPMVPAPPSEISSEIQEFIRAKADTAKSWILSHFPKTAADGQPRKAAIIFSKFEPDSGMGPEQIAAQICGAAKACYLQTGPLATDTFQLTALGEGKDRESQRFRIPVPSDAESKQDDLDDDSDIENPWSGLIVELRREIRRLNAELTDVRTRFDFQRQEADARTQELVSELHLKSEDRLDALRKSYEAKIDTTVTWARDFTKEAVSDERKWAHEQITGERKDARARVTELEQRCDALVDRVSEFGRRAMEPTEQMMGTVLGLISSATDMQSKAFDITIVREEMSAETARESRRWGAFERTIGSMGDIGAAIIEAKYGPKGREIANKLRQVFKDPSVAAAATATSAPGTKTDGAGGESPASSTSVAEAKHPKYAELVSMRDAMFTTLTEADIAVMRAHAGDELTDRVFALKDQNPIDLTELGGIIGTISSLSQPKAIALFRELSSPTASALMSIGKIADELADAFATKEP